MKKIIFNIIICFTIIFLVMFYYDNIKIHNIDENKLEKNNLTLLKEATNFKVEDKIELDYKNKKNYS